jgi:hypothetical protein
MQWCDWRLCVTPSYTGYFCRWSHGMKQFSIAYKTLR